MLPIDNDHEGVTLLGGMADSRNDGTEWRMTEMDVL